MIHDKIKDYHSYQVATNYWTPLHNNDDDDNESKEATYEINAIASTTVTTKQTENKWTRRVARRQNQRIILDSGATSHFISEDMNLPKGDKLFKEVRKYGRVEGVGVSGRRQTAGTADGPLIGP